MTILNEYLLYLDEEKKDDEKKSKWKERAKKYGKIALGAAAVGAAAYAGKKAYDKSKEKKSLFSNLVKKHKDWRDKSNKEFKDRIERAKSNVAKEKAEKAARKEERVKAKADRKKRNEETTKSKYKRWERERERAKDEIKREKWLKALQDKKRKSDRKGPIDKIADKVKDWSVVKKLNKKLND
jgi:hypothetical protein